MHISSLCMIPKFKFFSDLKTSFEKGQMERDLQRLTYPVAAKKPSGIMDSHPQIATLSNKNNKKLENQMLHKNEINENKNGGIACSSGK